MGATYTRPRRQRFPSRRITISRDSVSWSELPAARHARLFSRLPAAVPAAAPAAAPITVPFALLPRMVPSTAPATAPPTTFVRSLLPDTRSVSIWLSAATSPSPGYDSPFTSIARTWKWILLASTGLARSTAVTSSTTVAPAGMTAPLLPTVAEETVAVNLSPTSADVQVRSFIVMLTRAPMPMTPAAGPGAGAGVASDARSTGAGAGAVGRGVRATGAAGDSRRGVGVGRRVRAGDGRSAAGARDAGSSPPRGA